MVRNLILSTAILLLVQLPASADDVSDFDILGMSVGMSPGEIENVGTKNDLRKVGSFPAPSFDQQVALNNGDRVAARDYAGLQSMELESGAKEVEVFFVATPSGPKTWKIVYRHVGSDLTNEAMADLVAETYGPPDKKVMGRAVWGDTALPFSRKSAWLEYDDSPPTAHGARPIGTLTLSDPAFEQRAQGAITKRAKESQ